MVTSLPANLTQDFLFQCLGVLPRRGEAQPDNDTNGSSVETPESNQSNSQ